MKLYKIICLLAILSSYSCEEERMGIEAFYAENYINRYYDGGIELRMLERYYGAPDPTILQTGFVIAPSGGIEYGPWYYDSYAKEQFLKIAERNGDTSFNREVWGGDQLGEAFADNFLELHVVSNADWDETHLAGNPLDDILLAYLDSYAKIIHDGYKINGHDIDFSKKDNFITCKKMVSELTSADMKMLCYSLNYYGSDTRNPMIVFTSAPTLAKTHTLTLSWTTVEGNVKTASVTCTPEVDPTLL